MTRYDLVLRNVRPMGSALTDIGIRGGVIAGIGNGFAGPEIDGRGNALLPGLIDHHIHLLATAARLDSVELAGVGSVDAIIGRLRAAAKRPGSWLRATGYDEAVAGLPDAAELARWLPDHPLRMQDRTGALWLLNARALALLGPPPYPDSVELADGVPTGRIWRGDLWLRTRIASGPPALGALGMQLASYGITGVTDAGADNGAAEAALLAGALPQRLMLLGREDLPLSDAYARGPLKLLLDDRALPEIAALAARIAAARATERNVAAHCVTAAELLVFLSALDDAGGARAGDRIEHGSIIPAGLIADIAQRGLTVVAQPVFVHDRGDRYIMQVDEVDLPDLYRLRSLRTSGVRIAAGSDAPYGAIDPWRGIAAAIDRRTAQGKVLGPGECLGADAARALYFGSFDDPGGPSRRLVVGAPADLCLLGCSLDALADQANDGQVAATIVAGKIIHNAIA